MMLRALAWVTALAMAGCHSPEATRTQGGGPGADTGNRNETVRMHEGSSPFHGTPQLVPGKGAPVESAQNARVSSR